MEYDILLLYVSVIMRCWDITRCNCLSCFNVSCAVKSNKMLPAAPNVLNLDIYIYREREDIKIASVSVRMCWI